MKVQFSEELAYWIGAAQSDGSLKSYLKKTTGYVDVRISFGVKAKSLPMVQKFQRISEKVFNRHTKIWKGKNGIWYHNLAAKSLLSVFDDLDIKFKDPPRPPKWILENPKYFGAYLAGVIDGDGCIWKVKYRSSKKPIEYRIKITSGKEQRDLADAIRKRLCCTVRIVLIKGVSVLDGRIIRGSGYNLEFNISSKNLNFLKQFVLPHLAVKHKRERLENYIALKMARIV